MLVEKQEVDEWLSSECKVGSPHRSLNYHLVTHAFTNISAIVSKEVSVWMARKKTWWEKLSAKHKKKYGIVIGTIAFFGTVGGFYKTWSAYYHEWFTPEFSIEFHKSWDSLGIGRAMSTPYHSSKTGSCEDDVIDEVLYAKVRNNHSHPATLRSITISVSDWSGWHKGTTIKSPTQLVFMPDRTQCEPSPMPGEGCYYQFGDNREMLLDSALPRITLPPGQVITGYFEMKWDGLVDPQKITAYRAVTIDDNKEERETPIEPPEGPGHKDDEIFVAYHRHPIGWTPDCRTIPMEAER